MVLVIPNHLVIFRRYLILYFTSYDVKYENYSFIKTTSRDFFYLGIHHEGKA